MKETDLGQSLLRILDICDVDASLHFNFACVVDDVNDECCKKCDFKLQKVQSSRSVLSLHM